MTQNCACRVGDEFRPEEPAYCGADEEELDGGIDGGGENQGVDDGGEGGEEWFEGGKEEVGCD